MKGDQQSEAFRGGLLPYKDKEYGDMSPDGPKVGARPWGSGQELRIFFEILKYFTV